MAVFGISVKGLIKPNLKALALPIGLLIVLVLSAFVVATNGIKQISAEIIKLREAKSAVVQLEEKEGLLKRIQGVVLSQADASVIALPDKNPGLIMLSQLNASSETKQVELKEKNIRIGGGINKTLPGALISFKTESDLATVLGFLKEIKALAPVSNLEQINISQDEGVFSVTTELIVYWSDFPTEIPKVSEPVTSLSPSEQALLDEITKLVKPQFIEFAPSAPSVRENPFN